MAGRHVVLFVGLLAGAWPALPAPGLAADAEVTGIGVVVSAAGDVLAPFHVVAECARLRSPALGRLHVMHADSAVDLVHLGAEVHPATYAYFGDGAKLGPGDGLTVLELAGGAVPEPVSRTATVQALVDGMRQAAYLSVLDSGRARAGGALLLDRSGGLVGLVVRDLDIAAMPGTVRLWGEAPPEGAVLRNAVGEAMLRHFLDHHHVAYGMTTAGALSAQDAAARARTAMAPIECDR